ncbi:unnamed protein product, partial [Ixodes hexagonus]
LRFPRETTYDITLGYHGYDGSVPFNGYYYVNSKLNIPSRYVAILKTIPMLTPSSVLAIFGGYLGFWLGLSIYSGVTRIMGYVQRGITGRLRNTFNKARFNFTRMCKENPFMDCSDNDSQRVVGSYLDVTVKLIEYSYSRDKVIYDCRFVSSDDACGDFDCADL